MTHPRLSISISILASDDDTSKSSEASKNGKSIGLFKLKLRFSYFVIWKFQKWRCISWQVNKFLLSLRRHDLSQNWRKLEAWFMDLIAGVNWNVVFNTKSHQNVNFPRSTCPIKMPQKTCCNLFYCSSVFSSNSHSELFESFNWFPYEALFEYADKIKTNNSF
jgi:hypothetical protein